MGKVKTVEEDIMDALNEIEGQDDVENEKDIQTSTDKEDQEKEFEEEGEKEVIENKDEKKAASKKEPEKEPEKEIKEPKQDHSQNQKQEEKKQESSINPPQSWSGVAKEKWGNLPKEVQSEISKREADVHRMFTAQDGELRMGREMKDIITPYMPIIQAEGGNPVTAVQNLLNTAYQLRTGTPHQKAKLVAQIAQQYNVDMGQLQTAQEVDPVITQLQNELNGLKTQLHQGQSLQEQQELAKIQEEVNAFAADPANIYFQDVKAAIASYMDTGQSKTLQEAYDMACWANPQIRAQLLQKQQEQEAEKKKEAISKKKQAASSLTGSPSRETNSGKSQNRTLEEELSDAYDELLGGRV